MFFLTWHHYSQSDQAKWRDLSNKLTYTLENESVQWCCIVWSAQNLISCLQLPAPSSLLTYLTSSLSHQYILLVLLVFSQWPSSSLFPPPLSSSSLLLPSPPPFYSSSLFLPSPPTLSSYSLLLLSPPPLSSSPTPSSIEDHHRNIHGTTSRTMEIFLLFSICLGLFFCLMLSYVTIQKKKHSTTSPFLKWEQQAPPPPPPNWDDYPAPPPTYTKHNLYPLQQLDIKKEAMFS